MNLLKRLWLDFRLSRRLGAFKRAQEQGASIQEARAYSDGLYPPTPEEAAYEQHLRNVQMGKEIVEAARKMAEAEGLDFRKLSPERQTELTERAAQAMGIRLS